MKIINETSKDIFLKMKQADGTIVEILLHPKDSYNPKCFELIIFER